MAIIIFDFDDTLHDTKRLKDDIQKVLLSYNINEKDISNSYKIARADLDYSFEKHISILSNMYRNLNSTKLLLDLNSLFLNNYIFDKVEETLKTLKNSHRLILLTNGENTIQNIKINNSKLKNYFESIHVTQEHKVNTLKKIELSGEVYFINDKIEENTEIKKEFPEFIYFTSMNELPIK